MKTLFIPAKINQEIPNLKKLKLPKNIAITYSIQYQDQAKKIKQLLSKNHKITLFTQVLGCSNPKFPKNTKAVLLVSDGKFHAINIAMKTNLPTYIVNSKIQKIKNSEIQKLKQKKKAAYLKYLNQDKVGILITTKPGQQRLKQAINIKKKLKKQSYLFICNNINTTEFENFGLNSYINTACPRLAEDDSRIINSSDI